MQTESTSSVRRVRWLGALTFLAAPFALASGCTAGEMQTEQTATVEQALDCSCFPTSLCGLDTCSSTHGTGFCTDLCTRDEVMCYFQADGRTCTTSGGLGGKCASGICISTECAGCINSSKVCVAGTSVGACGSDGAKCENCNDGNPCTTDSCYENTKTGLRFCRHLAASEGTTCTGGVCVDTTCCEGCIDGDGACQPGTLPGACGMNGVACQTCPDGDENQIGRAHV